MPEVKEIVVVCDPSYEDIFEGMKIITLWIQIHRNSTYALTMHLSYSFTVINKLSCWVVRGNNTTLFFCFSDSKEKIQVDLKFALPGKERQDSVYSGLQVHTRYLLLVKFILLNIVQGVN